MSMIDPPDARASGRWVGNPTTWTSKGESRYDRVRILGQVFAVGDTVHLRSPQGDPPFIARITKLWEGGDSSDKLCECAWYFRPKDLEPAMTKRLGVNLEQNEVRPPLQP
jgi:hypothetical protein